MWAGAGLLASLVLSVVLPTSLQNLMFNTLFFSPTLIGGMLLVGSLLAIVRLPLRAGHALIVACSLCLLGLALVGLPFAPTLPELVPSLSGVLGVGLGLFASRGLITRLSR